MKIDLSKAQADLDKIRVQKRDLLERIENLTESEHQLAAFINLAQQYETPGKDRRALAMERVQRAAAKTAATKTAAKEPAKDAKGATKDTTRFQPHKYPPQPIPEGYKSPSRRMELVRRIAETFDPNSVITAGEIIEKIKPVYQIPESAHSEIHHVATILVHEKGPGAAIEKIGDKQWRVRANALEIVQSRIAAEIAESNEESARRIRAN